MALWQWSTTAGSNASAGTINWAEGQPASTVNDSARQMMADVAAWYAGPEWLNYGLTPTYISGTQFTVSGNKTTIYSVGRRVRAFVTAGTIYGTITASAFTSLTTITVSWSSGALDSGLSEVDVGIMNPANSSLPTLPTLTVSGSSIQLGSGQNSNINYFLTNANTNGLFYLDTFGSHGFYDVGRSITRWSSDTAGNFIAAGNVTANSDERLKTDWESPPSDFVERLATVKSGTYTRVDIEGSARHAGVGAQSLRDVLPEAVLEGAQGMLSVAYGNAALVACVELAKEVMRLRALLEPVK